MQGSLASTMPPATPRLDAEDSALFARFRAVRAEAAFEKPIHGEADLPPAWRTATRRMRDLRNLGRLQRLESSIATAGDAQDTRVLQEGTHVPYRTGHFTTKAWDQRFRWQTSSGSYGVSTNWHPAFGRPSSGPAAARAGPPCVNKAAARGSQIYSINSFGDGGRLDTARATASVTGTTFHPPQAFARIMQTTAMRSMSSSGLGVKNAPVNTDAPPSARRRSYFKLDLTTVDNTAPSSTPRPVSAREQARKVASRPADAPWSPTGKRELHNAFLPPRDATKVWAAKSTGIGGASHREAFDGRSEQEKKDARKPANVPLPWPAKSGPHKPHRGSASGPYSMVRV